MFKNINPRQLEGMMRKMGVKQTPIDAKVVIIRTGDKELVINNPVVSKVNLMGQESLQIVGDIEERQLKSYNEDDVRTVISQAGCSEIAAKNALEKAKGNIAEAILELTK